MNFAISDRFTIITPLSQDEVKQRLESVVEPPKRQIFAIPSTWKRKPYQGTISANSFRIERVIGYRNSFLPIIQGKLTQLNQNTSIEISMDMSTFIFAFMSLWLLFAGFMAFCALCTGISEGRLGWMHLGPIALLVFGIAMPKIGFQVEANKSKAFLYKLFAADEDAGL